MLKSLWVLPFLVLGACAMADDQTRTITVSGTGIAEAAPDRATLRMSIISRESTIDAAQNGAAVVTNNVLEMTDEMDIDRDNVDTTGASVRPDYRWNRNTEEQELRGYIAERQISVVIEDLDDLGAAIEGAVKAGVNNVSPPQLGSSTQDSLYRDALQAAAADARANAERLADSLGTNLGRVLSISTGSHAPQPPIAYNARSAMMSMDSTEAAQTYNPAEMSVSATVNVVFELTD